MGKEGGERQVNTGEWERKAGNDGRHGRCERKIDRKIEQEGRNGMWKNEGRRNAYRKGM